MFVCFVWPQRQRLSFELHHHRRLKKNKTKVKQFFLSFLVRLLSISVEAFRWRAIAEEKKKERKKTLGTTGWTSIQTDVLWLNWLHSIWLEIATAAQHRPHPTIGFGLCASTCHPWRMKGGNCSMDQWPITLHRIDESRAKTGGCAFRLDHSRGFRFEKQKTHFYSMAATHIQRNLREWNLAATFPFFSCRVTHGANQMSQSKESRMNFKSRLNTKQN